MRILAILVIVTLLLTGCSAHSPEASQPPHTTASVETTKVTVPSQPTRPEGTALSEEELQKYEQVFSFSLEPFNWSSQAVYVPYDSPENLNLAVFFWNGVGDQTLSDKETAFLTDAGCDFNYDITRISVAEAGPILEQYFGITWSETSGVGLDGIIYNQEENCYYRLATGANFLEGLDIRSGIRMEDGSLCLYYTKSGLNILYAVTFFEQDSSDGTTYRFVSNVLCE